MNRGARTCIHVLFLSVSLFSVRPCTLQCFLIVASLSWERTPRGLHVGSLMKCTQITDNAYLSIDNSCKVSLEMSLTERLISRVWQLKVSRSGSWSGLPLKSNQLVLGPRPSAPKKIHNLLRYAAKCHSMPYLIMVKYPGKWSRICTKESGSPPESNQFLRGWAMTHLHLSTLHLSTKCRRNLFITFGDILHIYQWYIIIRIPAESEADN